CSGGAAQYQGGSEAARLRASGGELAALDLRLGQTHEAHLERAHRRVPAEALLAAVLAALRSDLLLDAPGEHDHLEDRDDDEAPQRDERPVRDLGAGHERGDDDDDHEDHDPLAEVPARVDVVPDPAALRTLVARGEVLLL